MHAIHDTAAPLSKGTNKQHRNTGKSNRELIVHTQQSTSRTTMRKLLLWRYTAHETQQYTWSALRHVAALTTSPRSSALTGNATRRVAPCWMSNGFPPDLDELRRRSPWDSRQVSPCIPA
ncbi:unnamed protein product [Ectocarpus sp. 8 AP-2014]